MNTKPFDLAKALGGARLVTATGLPVRIICHDCRNKFYPIIGLILTSPETEFVEFYNDEGVAMYADIYHHKRDLRIVEEQV